MATAKVHSIFFDLGLQGKCQQSDRLLTPSPPCTSSLEPLPFFRRILLLQVLRILIAQLVVRVPDRLFYPLLAAQANNGANALLDAPSRRDTRHADVVFLRNLLYATDYLLIDLVFARVHEVFEELVGLRAAGGAVRPGTGEGAAGNGGPWDEAHAGVLTVWDLVIL